MKKLIFMLLMLTVMCGMIFATADHQQSGVFNPETVLAEYGVHEGVVTQPTDTVLVKEECGIGCSCLTIMAHNYLRAILQK
jgi:hypothetical protein